MEKYYKNLNTGSVYKSEKIIYNDGTDGMSLRRWSWDFCSWNGHVHNHELTRKQLSEGIVIVPITKEEAMKLIQ